MLERGGPHAGHMVPQGPYANEGMIAKLKASRNRLTSIKKLRSGLDNVSQRSPV